MRFDPLNESFEWGIKDKLLPVCHKGGGGTTTTVQKSDPWSGATPYLAYGLDQMNNWYGSAKNQPGYGGKTYADQNWMTQTGQGMTSDRAQSPNYLQQEAENQTLATMRGDYLNPMSTQAGRAMSDSMAERYLGQMGSRYADNASSSARDLMTGKAYGEMMAQMYAPERQNMMAATQFAPQLREAGYADADRMLSLGDQQRQYEQGYLDDQLRRFEYERDRPLELIKQYLNMAMGAAGQGALGSTEMRSMGNPYAWTQGVGSLLGGGAAMYDMFQ